MFRDGNALPAGRIPPAGAAGKRPVRRLLLLPLLLSGSLLLRRRTLGARPPGVCALGDRQARVPCVLTGVWMLRHIEVVVLVSASEFAKAAARH